MLTYRPEIKHFHQYKGYNCGPVALSCLFANPLSEIEKLVRCTSQGTNALNVASALRKSNVKHNFIWLRGREDNLWWITSLCYRWPVYASCNYVTQGARGRPSEARHAVLFAHGKCYDGNYLRPEPIETISQSFNKRLEINSLIIFDHELPGWTASLSREIMAL